MSGIPSCPLFNWCQNSLSYVSSARLVSWHWSAVPGHLLPSALSDLLPCRASLSEQRKLSLLSCQAHFHKSSILGENISLHHAKYLRSLRASGGITRGEKRGWFPQLNLRTNPQRNKTLRSPHEGCCWQTLHKQDSSRHCHKGPQCFLQPVSLVGWGAMRYLNVNGRRLLAEKRALITSLWTAAPSSSFQALCRSCSRARRWKWTQRPALGTAEVIEAWGNGCSYQLRGIRFLGSPRPLGFLSFLLLLMTELIKHPRKTTRQPLADVNLSNLGFGLEWLRPGWRWNTNQEHVSFGKN